MSDENVRNNVEDEQPDGVLEESLVGVDVSTWEEDDNPLNFEGEDLSDEEVRASFEPDDVDASDDGEPMVLTIEDVEAFLDEIRSASWHLAPSLVRLRAEINKKWPRRDKRSDGSIGDASHSARYSDHNPNSRRSVNAIDIDKDGVSPMTIVNAAKKHPSCNYIIYNRVIYSRVRGFRARRYTGSNPHTMHIHVSISQTRSAENNTRYWLTSAPAPAPKPKPGTTAPRWPHGPGDYYSPYLSSAQARSLGQRHYLRGDAPYRSGVRAIQARLKDRGWDVSVDGRFGPETARIIRAFQREKRLGVDGLIGPKTWRAVWESPIT